MSPETGRPTLLHTDELRYHYGAVVAASRESELWLAQLSDEGITGPQAMIDYVAELVERRLLNIPVSTQRSGDIDLWQPTPSHLFSKQSTEVITHSAGCG
ncbi:hypothetical protein E4U23_007028 [Claviceps purpurea]|nr:hypothetical protein E4U23_007028 [Claviceps purpurea]